MPILEIAGKRVEFASMPSADEIDEVAKSFATQASTPQPEKMVGSVFGKVPESAYQAGERNILGNVFERPGAAIRSAIQGKGYTAGAVNPTNVPTFQDLAIQKSQVTTSPVANAALGMIPSAVGMAADMATNPADVLTSIIPGLKPVKDAERAISATREGQAIKKAVTTPISIKPVEKFLSPMAQKTDELLTKNAKVYRQVLNPGKDIIQKVEVKSGKKIDDFMKLAADENLVINQTPEGKLDTKAAVTALKDRKVELNAQLENALESDQSKRFSLIDIGEQAKANLAKHTRNASELKTAVKSVDDQIADEIALHGDIVDGVTANRIKGGMWDVSYSPLEPNKNKISRQIGFSIKDAIEKGYPDQAIKETNARLGDFVTLESILKKSDGNAIQRGRIGNYVGNIVGMSVGGSLGSVAGPVGTAVGSATGAGIGGAASKFLVNPTRITKGLPKDISALQKLGSELGDNLRVAKIPSKTTKTPIPSIKGKSSVTGAVKGKTLIKSKNKKSTPIKRKGE